MTRNLFILILCGVLLVFCTTAVQAGDQKVTPQQVIELVKKAVKLIQEKGPDQAFPILSDPKGEFVHGDLYVFTYNMDGTIVQHLRPKLVGKNMMNIKDKKGKCLACDFLRIAREKGEGWSEYWWPRPGSGELSLKVSYIMRVPNMELFAGVGIYDITKKEVEEAMKKE
ncbi:cache domain-containing protein [Desulfobacterales bacterium HSG2]|nr:cache domain-containing protein [Desulfobacterales bacterium HSG2]